MKRGSGRVHQFHAIPPPEKPDFDAAAEVLLRVAEEVEQAEALLKAEITRALEGGDTERALRIVRRWQVEAPVTVAAEEA